MTPADWFKAVLGLVLAGIVFVLWIQGLGGAWDAEQTRKHTPPDGSRIPKTPAPAHHDARDAALLVLAASGIVGMALALHLSPASIAQIAFVGTIAATVFYRSRRHPRP